MEIRKKILVYIMPIPDGKNVEKYKVSFDCS